VPWCSPGTFCLRVAEPPHLVALDDLAWQIDQETVLVGRADSSEIDQELRDRVLRCARDADGRSVLFPSTRQPMIWARFSVVSRFMLTIYA
jgi:hypothetical protein